MTSENLPELSPKREVEAANNPAARYWKDFSQDEQKAFDKDIESALGHHKKIIDQGLEPTNRFLSFVNAGGVALMMGIVPSFLDKKLSVLPLLSAAVCFTFGMIALGLRIVLDLQWETLMFNSLIRDRKAVREHKISPLEIPDRHTKRQATPSRSFIVRLQLRIISFVLFILGCLIAIFGIGWVVVNRPA